MYREDTGHVEERLVRDALAQNDERARGPRPRITQAAGGIS